jgi:hypothetical protein
VSLRLIIRTCQDLNIKANNNQAGGFHGGDYYKGLRNRAQSVNAL